MKKYIIRYREIGLKEAAVRKADLLREALSSGWRNLRDAWSILFLPLETGTQWQEEVLPGHPDYEKASFVFSPKDCIGDIEWWTLTVDDLPKHEMSGHDQFS